MKHAFMTILLALSAASLAACDDGKSGNGDGGADTDGDTSEPFIFDGDADGDPETAGDPDAAEGDGDVPSDDALEEEETPPPAIPVLADYNSELREGTPRDDGHTHVDSPLLVERLVALNANTYAFLIYHDTADWDDLQEYLPLAEAAGLETWVYLVPPTELPAAYPPYEDDYVAWGRGIGELAASYPSLTAFAMDDFNGNLSTFTVETTCAMLDAAKEGRPDIRFYAVDYFSSVMRDFRRNDFRGCIDGIIFPYIDLDSNADFRAQIDTIATLRDTGLAISFSYPSDTSSAAGDYIRYSLPCTTDGSDGRVTFYYMDSYPGVTTGYHFARVLYGTDELWSEDIGGEEGVELREATFTTVSGTPLVFELYDNQGVGNFGVTVDFSSVNVEGCGDAAPGNWVQDSNNTLFSGTVADARAYPGLEIFPMIYATSTSWHSEPPTTAIIEEAVSIALQSWDDGISQGPITYCLAKDPVTDPDYVAVQALYGAYADGVP